MNSCSFKVLNDPSTAKYKTTESTTMSSIVPLEGVKS